MIRFRFEISIITILLLAAVARPGPLSAQAPVLELDHVYIVVPAGAAQAVEALRRVGVLVDTVTNRHDGEGVTSIAAFFHNTYLELLWVDSTVAVDSAHQTDVAEFRRATAWHQTGASPFGLGLHFLVGTVEDLRLPVRLDPIPGTNPPSAWVLLRQPAESLATDMFIMPLDRAVTSWIERFRSRRPEFFAHPLGVQRVTRIVIQGPSPERPRAADLDLRPIRFDTAVEPLLLIEFDGGQAGETLDLRPALPLVLRR